MVAPSAHSTAPCCSHKDGRSYGEQLHGTCVPYCPPRHILNRASPASSVHALFNATPSLATPAAAKQALCRLVAADAARPHPPSPLPISLPPPSETIQCRVTLPAMGNSGPTPARLGRPSRPASPRTSAGKGKDRAARCHRAGEHAPARPVTVRATPPQPPFLFLPCYLCVQLSVYHLPTDAERHRHSRAWWRLYRYPSPPAVRQLRVSR